VIFLKITYLHLNELTGQLYAEIKSKNNTYCILLDNIGYSCTCLDNSMKHMNDYQYRCKHLNFLFLELLDEKNLTIIEKYMNSIGANNMAFLRTGLKFLDEQFGGIPQGILFGMVGEPESGKTTLLMQLAYHISFVEDGDFAIIDGEGGFYDFVVKHWVNVYNEKYQYDIGIDLWEIDYLTWEKAKDKSNVKMIHKIDSGKNRRIHIINLLSEDGVEPVFKLNLLVGKPSIINLSSKGKHSLKSHPAQEHFRNIKNTLFGKFIEGKFFEKGDEKRKIIGIGLDSLTMVIETKYSSENESFPARAKNNMQVCHQLQRLLSAYNLYGIVNHHMTSNPAQGSYAPRLMTGGKGTRHNYKYQLLITIWGSSPSTRWAHVLRSQTKARGSKMTFDITADGIVDIVKRKAKE